MEKVMIESPYRGQSLQEQRDNQQYAMLCVEDSIARGEAPFASHLFYTHWLDDRDAKERLQGMNAGWAWLAAADRVAVYTDRGISEGMESAIQMALDLGLPVEKRSIKDEASPK